jgi:hypothetical protein
MPGPEGLPYVARDKRFATTCIWRRNRPARRRRGVVGDGEWDGVHGVYPVVGRKGCYHQQPTIAAGRTVVVETSLRGGTPASAGAGKSDLRAVMDFLLPAVV